MPPTANTTANTGNANRILTPELLKAGFTEVVEVPATPRLVLSTEAQTKLGKTHFALTAPGPIALMTTDTGTEEVARKFIRDKKFIKLKIKSPADLLEEGKGYKDEWKRAKDGFRALIANRTVRTAVVDTASEWWELCRLAAFGKLTQVMPHHYGPVNEEFRNLIKEAYERPDLNLILIHKVKKEYKSGKDGKDSWSGRYERAGMGDVPYLVDVVLEHYRVPMAEGPGCEFGVKVLDSRLNPSETLGLELQGEENEFAFLAVKAWPDTDPTYWL